MSFSSGGVYLNMRGGMRKCGGNATKNACFWHHHFYSENVKHMSDKLSERPASLKKYDFWYEERGHYEIQFLKKELLHAAAFHTFYHAHTSSSTTKTL